MKKILGALQNLPANQRSQFSHNLWNWTGLGVLVSWQILKGSQNFLHIFSMALYHKWDVNLSMYFIFSHLLLTIQVVETTTQEPFFSPTLFIDSKEKSDSNITVRFICGSCLPTWRLVIRQYPSNGDITFLHFLKTYYFFGFGRNTLDFKTMRASL